MRQPPSEQRAWARAILSRPMDFAGIFGGYVAEAAVSGLSWQQYLERAFSYIAYSDIIPAMLKTIVFGYLIAVVSSYLGFPTSRGTEGHARDAQLKERRAP